MFPSSTCWLYFKCTCCFVLSVMNKKSFLELKVTHLPRLQIAYVLLNFLQYFIWNTIDILHYFKNITKNLTVRKPMKSFITFFFEISMWYTLTHRTHVNNVHCLNVQYYNYIYYMLNDINYMILKYSYTGLWHGRPHVRVSITQGLHNLWFISFWIL